MGNDKTCPLSMIGYSGHGILHCECERCMLWFETDGFKGCSLQYYLTAQEPDYEMFQDNEDDPEPKNISPYI